MILNAAILSLVSFKLCPLFMKELMFVLQESDG